MGGKYLSLNVEALVAASLLFQLIHFSTAAIGAFIRLDILKNENIAQLN